MRYDCSWGDVWFGLRLCVGVGCGVLGGVV